MFFVELKKNNIFVKRRKILLKNNNVPLLWGRRLQKLRHFY